jgi:hypothetical protein
LAVEADFAKFILIAKFLPRRFHVPPLSVRLADAEAERQAVVEPGVADEQLAGGVGAVQDPLRRLAARAMAEPDGREKQDRNGFRK